MWGWVYEERRGVGMWLSTLVPVVLERDKHFVVRLFSWIPRPSLLALKYNV